MSTGISKSGGKTVKEMGSGVKIMLHLPLCVWSGGGVQVMLYLPFPRSSTFVGHKVPSSAVTTTLTGSPPVDLSLTLQF